MIIANHSYLILLILNLSSMLHNWDS